MSDQDKPKRGKIDLKARLSSVRASGSMAGASSPSQAGTGSEAGFPPPPVSGAVPPPRVLGGAPIPGLSPFASEPEREKEAPKAQTIKVEMGEEVIAERKKAAKKWILYIVIASVVTGVLGFALGGLKKAGDIGRESVKGAGELAKEVEKSNQVMVELSDAIGQGIEQLKPGNDKYPNELATKIKSINIPFEVSLLRGRVIGGLPGNVLQAVLAYAGGVKDTNETKDKLGGLLGQAKESVEKVFQQKKEPAVNFSVVFSEGGGGLVAELVRHKQPFAQKGKWPGSYTVVRSVGGKSKDVEADRYGGKGNLTGGDKAVAIPVEESTIAPYTAEAAIFQLRKVLADAKELLDGRQSPIPSLETEGLIKQGDRLMEELKKVMQAGGGG